jgi:hypothetical protein
MIDRDKAMSIIQAIANGAKIKDATIDHGVTYWVFHKWLCDDPELDGLYSRARAARMELITDEIIEIADNEVDAQKARNRIDARKWMASKLSPAKYGDRIDLNVNQSVDLKTPYLEAINRVNRLRADSSTVIEVKPTIIPITSDVTPTGYQPVTVDNADHSLDATAQTFDEQKPNK